MFQVDVSPQAAEDLAKDPDVGIPVERQVSFPTAYKIVLANNYSIFYRIKGKFVKVFRIMYSKRDFARVLFDGV